MGQKRSYIIGRGLKATARLPHDSVSRRHARLALDDERRLRLSDLESKYGTFVHRGGEWRPVADEHIADDEPVMFGKFRTTLAQVMDIIERQGSEETTGGWTDAEGETHKHTAVLMADVVGYTTMMSQDREGTLRAFRACRRDVVDPAILGHRGRIFKEVEDGLFAEFRSAADALRCANEIQTTLAARPYGRPRRPLVFRIGIHAGEAVAENDDLFGETVIIAERLQAMAEPGRICVFDIARAQIETELRPCWTDPREKTLKDYPDPVQVYEMVPGEIEPVQRKKGKAGAPTRKA